MSLRHGCRPGNMACGSIQALGVGPAVISFFFLARLLPGSVPGEDSPASVALLLSQGQPSSTIQPRAIIVQGFKGGALSPLPPEHKVCFWRDQPTVAFYSRFLGHKATLSLTKKKQKRRTRRGGPSSTSCQPGSSKSQGKVCLSFQRPDHRQFLASQLAIKPKKKKKKRQPHA